VQTPLSARLWQTPAVRDAFVAYARGEWTMPSKVYVPAYPDGDFRAMPALGGGHALLKWVTSFPDNPAHGLPTVTGLVLLSDASNGMFEAVLDAGAVTALRTGAAAVLAAETLGRRDATTAAVSKSNSWLMVAMMPFFINCLMMSTGVRFMRSARSFTVSATGNSTAFGPCGAAGCWGV